MSSVFDLNVDGTLPPVNQGVSQYKYDKITPTRSATGGNFEDGPIDFQFTMAGNKWWIPARSYLRVRVTIGTAAGGIPDVAAAYAAPVINPVAAAFVSGQMYLEDMELSKVNNFFPEIDTLKKRSGKSGYWLDNHGDSLDVWNPDFNDRLRRVSPGPSENITTSIIATDLLSTVAITAQATIGGAGTITLAGASLRHAEYAGIINIGDVLATAANPGELMEVVSVNLLVITYKALTPITQVAPAAAHAIYRLQDPIKDAILPRGANKLEFIWRPSFSVMEAEHALPVGNYRLELNPSNQYKNRMVQTLTAKTAGTDYDITIDNIDFYVASVIGPRMKTGTYYLDLDEVSAQSTNLTGNDSESQFTVSPKTYALSVAFMDSAAGSSALYPLTQFIERSGNERSLTRFQVQYAEQNKPAVQADPKFGIDGTNVNDRLRQRYSDNYLYHSMAFDSTGPESYQKWLERGPFYYLPFPKDDEDESTRAIVRYALANATQTKLLLFAHYKKVAIIQVQDGRVQDVRLQER